MTTRHIRLVATVLDEADRGPCIIADNSVGRVAIRVGHRWVTWGQLSGFSQASKSELVSGLSKALCLQKQEDSWK